MFKKICVYTFLILITIMLLGFSPIQSLKNTAISNLEPSSSNDLKEENIQLKRHIKVLEGRISLLTDALNELGATTSEHAANLWAKGIQTRNGYLQYYVSCEEMKNEFKKELSKAQRTSWVTGYSSPWVSNYDIVDKEKVNPLTYKFTITFDWATSIGPKNSTESTITITKRNTKWCVSDIEWGDNMKERVF